VDRASSALDRPALSEQAFAAMVSSPADGEPATLLASEHEGGLQGWAVVLPGHRVWAVELVVEPELSATEAEPVATALLHEARAVADSGAAPSLQWWVHQPGEHDDRVAAQTGFQPSRDLHQLKRPLPLDGWGPILPTRSFRPGEDDAAWLAVNNRAFAWHAEQGGWEQAQLAHGMAQEWFDVDDFLVYDDLDSGRLAGFCWTKVHADLDPVEGEIYVIGVDPDFVGRGLGRALTVAGLESLHRRHGITVGMLYVDADNVPAMTLYAHLGFTTYALDRAYVARTRSLG
jgi:mycothiol synthase